jgi:hypothetical protein
VDGQLDRVGVLELVDEDVIYLVDDRPLALVEAVLDGGEVQDAVLVQVGFPALLELDQIRSDPGTERLDAIRRVGRRAARDPCFCLLGEEGLDEAHPLESVAWPVTLVPWWAEQCDQFLPGEEAVDHFAGRPATVTKRETVDPA